MATDFTCRKGKNPSGLSRYALSANIYIFNTKLEERKEGEKRKGEKDAPFTVRRGFKFLIFQEEIKGDKKYRMCQVETFHRKMSTNTFFWTDHSFTIYRLNLTRPN